MYNFPRRFWAIFANIWVSFKMSFKRPSSVNMTINIGNKDSVLQRLTCTRTNKRNIENNRITDYIFSLGKVSSIKAKQLSFQKLFPALLALDHVAIGFFCY